MLALIVLLPLVGFLINGFWYASEVKSDRKASATVTGAIASACIGASFLFGLITFLQLVQMDPHHRVIEQTLFQWIAIDGLNIDFAFRIDALNSLFVLVITGVGTLIHIYSIGYMGQDPAPGKFFCYLNLFCACMLVLVLGSSLPVLFLGWEGVGLCSYLLISFWYTDDDKASAGKKAFIVNRVGDFGFLLGMFLIYTTFGTLDFVGLKAAISTGVSPVQLTAITSICLLLFVGCMGKSAQIPLYVWLPDAMAGPTPVSALIHAATMVTSGIYLVARLNFLYTLSPDAMEFVAMIGGLTAIFAATIAVAQNDIKKVLAYSTVSQLGYMFLACGVGAYVSGVFHVITHAFFKALLFLGAGSVIHGMHHEQDIQKMGALRKVMPWTFLVFGAGWLAICGIPPFSGFFSKDEILWHAFASSRSHLWLWLLGVVTALLTAFYMSRLFVLTFLGEARWPGGANAHSGPQDKMHKAAHGHDSHADSHGSHGDPHDHGHGQPHESPWVMVGPLVVLAVFSAIGGFIGIPHMSWLEHWLEPIIPGFAPLREGVHHETEWFLMGFSVVVALVGMGSAFYVYLSPARRQSLQQSLSGVLRVLENKWYVDEIYDTAIVRPLRAASHFLWKRIDVSIIDRAVLGVGTVSEMSGSALRTSQTGSTQIYIVTFAIGLLVIVGYALYGLV
jgi:NADH-quinone oxidoreductase subunit L